MPHLATLIIFLFNIIASSYLNPIYGRIRAQDLFIDQEFSTLTTRTRLLAYLFMSILLLITRSQPIKDPTFYLDHLSRNCPEADFGGGFGSSFGGGRGGGGGSGCFKCGQVGHISRNCTSTSARGGSGTIGPFNYTRFKDLVTSNQPISINVHVFQSK